MTKLGLTTPTGENESFLIDPSRPSVVDDRSGAQFAPTFLVDEAAEAYEVEAERRVRAEIDGLGLASHVDRLDRDGFTILSPDETGAGTLVDQALERVLQIAGDRAGIDAKDMKTGKRHADYATPFGQAQWEPSLLLEDPIFERLLMNRAKLSLITYLLGESSTLNHFSCIVKGPGSEYLPLHADQNASGPPPPFAPFSSVANATWALTDYDAGNGAICFVAGSHKFGRPPNAQEAVDLSLFQPVEAAAGSVIIWHGNTWHGALPRRNPGLRVCIVEYMQRWYLRPTEDLSTRISAEALARNTERFAVLTGVRRPVQEIGSTRSKAAKLGQFS